MFYIHRRHLGYQVSVLVVCIRQYVLSVVANSQSPDVIGNGTLSRRWPSIETTLDQSQVFPGMTLVY